MANNSEVIATLSEAWRLGSWAVDSDSMPTLDELRDLMYELRLMIFGGATCQLSRRLTSSGLTVISSSTQPDNDLTVIGALKTGDEQLCVEAHRPKHPEHGHRCIGLNLKPNGTIYRTVAYKQRRSPIQELRTAVVTHKAQLLRAMAQGAMALHLLLNASAETDPFANQRAQEVLHGASQNGDVFMNPDLRAAAALAQVQTPIQQVS